MPNYEERKKMEIYFIFKYISAAKFLLANYIWILNMTIDKYYAKFYFLNMFLSFSASIALCSILWRVKSAKMYHVLQIGYGLGRVFAVGIAKLFIMRKRDDILGILDSHTIYYMNQTNIGQNPASNDTTSACAGGNKIVIAFAICGGVCAVSSVLAFVFHILHLSSSDNNTNNAQLKSWGDIFSPGRCTGLTNCKGALMLVMLSVCFSLTSAADKCFLVYVMPITELSPLRMTPGEASSIVMCIFIFFTVGKFVGYGLSYVAKPQVSGNTIRGRSSKGR